MDLPSTALGFLPMCGGSCQRIYEITGPYLEDDLFDIQYVQSADVITLVHPGYAPRNLSRTGDTSWTLSVINFLPTINPPHGSFVTAFSAGANTYRYRVTALKEESLEESLPCREKTRIITGATQANPVEITSVGHGYSTGDEVYIESVGGMVELNARIFIITKTGADTFTLDGEDGTGHTAYTSGGTAARTYLRVDSAAAPSTSTPITLDISSVPGATQYNIYRELDGIYGFLGVSGGPLYRDTGLTQDNTDTPPSERDVFGEPGKYPSTVTYFQQRKMYANTDEFPEKVWGSRTGSFTNFTISTPLQDDDSVSFELAGRQVNSVKHMIDLGGLVVFTSGGEWAIKGDAAGILRPGEVNPQQVSYNGSGSVAPIIISNTALYIQSRGSIIRDLGFDYQVDNYKGNDLTIFAAHLFDNYTIKDWTFQQIPHSIVWVVRDDGVLLGLTYVREHQVWGWHRHDFDGLVESVVSVPEGSEDFLYLLIQRTVNGRSVRYVERMKTRRVIDIVNYVGLDSALSYDGRNTDAGKTMTLSGGTTWAYDEDLILTSSFSLFSAADIGNEIRLITTAGEQIRCRIISYTSPTIVDVRAHKTVPVELRSAATSSWDRAVDEIGGLWHLEGKKISIFGDGFVVANPNNEAYVERTVTNGSVALDKPYSVIHAGLPITAEIETLDIDTAQAETIVDKKKFVSKMTIFVESSRGIWAGIQPPASDSDFNGLTELKIRNEEGYDDPVALATGVVDLNIEPRWNNNGRVFIRQTDPIPLSVLAVAPAGLVPIRG